MSTSKEDVRMEQVRITAAAEEGVAVRVHAALTSAPT